MLSLIYFAGTFIASIALCEMCSTPIGIFIFGVATVMYAITGAYFKYLK